MKILKKLHLLHQLGGKDVTMKENRTKTDLLLLLRSSLPYFRLLSKVLIHLLKVTLVQACYQLAFFSSHYLTPISKEVFIKDGFRCVIVKEHLSIESSYFLSFRL